MSSISQDCINYCKVCDLAAKDDQFFKTFKRNNYYRAVLEHVEKEQGSLYYNELNENSVIKNNIQKASVNDRLGDPIIFDYEFGTFSPTTLRYAKVLEDISHLIELNGSRIAEIGAGYGGQYLVLRQFYKPESYSFFDLDPVLSLIKKYVDKTAQNDIALEYISANTQHKFEKIYDLVISNYAISECDIEAQEHYISNILLKSKRGYITYNHMRGYSFEEFVLRLKNEGKNIQIFEEKPQTSQKNFIITW